MIPVISASKVAGLIGQHPYQNQYEILYDLMCKDKLVQARIAELEERAHRKPFQQVKNDILANSTVKDIIYSGLRACQGTADIASVLADVETKAKTTIGLRYSGYAPEVQKALVSEIQGKVRTQRGLNNENHILDQYEQKHDVKVTERNTRNMRKDFGKFVLIGRTDGWVASENRIVDSKERTRFWPQVPVYDEIQLRTYMAMSGIPESELVERFPDGTSRVTKYLNDPEKWEVIQTGLEAAVDTLRKAIANAEELKRIVFMNTVEIPHGDQHKPGSAGRVSGSARLDL